MGAIGRDVRHEIAGDIRPHRPIAMIASEMRQLFEVNRSDPSWYGDLILSRE
jgi:hypothetical protein